MRKLLTGSMMLMILLTSFGCEVKAAEIVPSENAGSAAVTAETVEATELDLGDYAAEMTVGQKQLLTVTVLPETATNQELTYQSSNTDVAAINGMGRITAVSVGTAQITVNCGTVSGGFLLTVSEEEPETEEAVAVSDIEIGDYEEELNVDATLTLSANVLPGDASDTTVTYQSSNNQIATVNSSGEVKGIAPGQVTISVTAGGITKQVFLTVKIAATAIVLNSDYRVMKPGTTYQLTASVEPEGASGSLTYKSLDTAVASVSDSGLITAKASGNTAIIVSNGELQVSVTVIVNEEGIVEEETDVQSEISEDGEEKVPERITVQEYPVVTSAMLKYLYRNKKTVTIVGDKYTIYLDGANIVNTENELYTKLLFHKKDTGFSMEVNNGKKLCGKIVIELGEKVAGERYLYLYNAEKGTYQKLSTDTMTSLEIDTAGTYLLTTEKLSGFKIHKAVVGGGCVLILAVAGIFIGIRRQYWFW